MLSLSAYTALRQNAGAVIVLTKCFEGLLFVRSAANDKLQVLLECCCSLLIDVTVISIAIASSITPFLALWSISPCLGGLPCPLFFQHPFFLSLRCMSVPQRYRGNRFLSVPGQHTALARYDRQRYDTPLQQCCNDTLMLRLWADVFAANQIQCIMLSPTPASAIHSQSIPYRRRVETVPRQSVHIIGTSCQTCCCSAFDMILLLKSIRYHTCCCNASYAQVNVALYRTCIVTLHSNCF